MPLQPIETAYRGYRFRNRTEARWTVFFDSLRIRFAYEAEGFGPSMRPRLLLTFPSP